MTTGIGERGKEWYALRVRSRHEKQVANSARNRGFEEFLPFYQRRHRWSDRIKTVEEPLFPGYVFCRLEIERRLPLLTIPGVLHFVGLGRTPLPIDETEVVAIQTAIQWKLWTEPWPWVELGQRVRVIDGPLTGVEGLLVENRKQFRVVISVTMLKRAVAVEIERDWVTPLDSSGGFALRPVGTPVGLATEPA
jgi:transcription antitermination factor NusG